MKLFKIISSFTLILFTLLILTQNSAAISYHCDSYDPFRCPSDYDGDGYLEDLYDLNDPDPADTPEPCQEWGWEEIVEYEEECQTIWEFECCDDFSVCWGVTFNDPESVEYFLDDPSEASLSCALEAVFNDCWDVPIYVAVSVCLKY